MTAQSHNRFVFCVVVVKSVVDGNQALIRKLGIWKRKCNLNSYNEEGASDVARIPRLSLELG